MSSIVADTHSIIWYLSNSPRLSSAALDAFEDAYHSGGNTYISTLTIIEIIYLVEKGRIPQQAKKQLMKALEKPEGFLTIIPLDLEISLAIESIPRDKVPDMPDRIIAATAHFLNLPLITCDHKIKSGAFPYCDISPEFLSCSRQHQLCSANHMFFNLI